MEPKRIPDTVIHIRVPADDGNMIWQGVHSDDIFKGRNVVLFGLPGAFTPACSESHLPGFEERHDEICNQGVDEVICVSVNDAFVMFHWAKALGIEKVQMLPDGNGDLTNNIGMLVSRSEQGLGRHSWRYSMLVCDGVIQKLLAEPGQRDNPPGVPVTISGAETMLEYLQGRMSSA